MNKEELIEYIKSKREPISHCVDLTKYFIGRHKTLPVYLTKAFEQEFNSSMYELEQLQQENQKLKDRIDKAIEYINGAYEMACYTNSICLMQENIEDLLEILKGDKE